MTQGQSSTNIQANLSNIKGLDPLFNINKITSAVTPQTSTTAYLDTTFTLKQTDAWGATSKTITDNLGRVIKTIDAENNAQTQKYDKRGNVTIAYSSINNEHPSLFEYDALNRNVKSKQGNAVSRTIYDKLNRPIKQIDPRGIESTMQYDSLSRLTAQITDAQGLNYKTQYAYDAVGNQTQITDAKGSVFNYKYDTLSRLIESRDANNNGNERLRRYVYDQNSNVTHTAYYKAKTGGARVTDQVIQSQFDALDRLTQINRTQNAGQPVTDTLQTFTYDNASRMTSAIDFNTDSPVTANKVQHVQFAYDDFSRKTHEYQNTSSLLDITQNTANTVKTQYAAPNIQLETPNTITQTLPSGLITQNTYDLRGLLTKVQQLSGTPKTFATMQYDAAGRMRHASFGLGSDFNGNLALNQSYDRRGRLESRKYTFKNTTTLLKETLKYDVSSSLTKHEIYGKAVVNPILPAINNFNNTPSIVSPLTKDYSYDNAYRLTNLDKSNFIENDTQSRSWQFDQVGNRTNHKLLNGNTELENKDYSPNSDNEYSKITNKLGGGSVELNNTYDDRGNMTAHGNKTYTYDWANRLTSVKENQTLLVSYTYDALNRRSQKVTPLQKQQPQSTTIHS